MKVAEPDFRYHTLVVTVENKSGVLARVAGLFAQRGFNIESLAVAPTDDDRFSRLTIVVDVESAPLDRSSSSSTNLSTWSSSANSTPAALSSASS